MPHHPVSSTVYFWLVVNSLFSASFGFALPLIILREARKLRYMQNLKAQLFARGLAILLGLVGCGFGLDVVNEHFWSIQMLHMFVWLFASIFLVTFTIAVWSNRYALRSLYPQEDFVREQDLRLRLLAKLEACDQLMPLPRFEHKNGVIIYANRAARQLLEYTLQELHLKKPGELVHVDDRTAVLARLLSHDEHPYECRVLTASSRIIHVEVRSTHDPNDADIRITFLTDVTNYVEQRDRLMREFRLQRSSEVRRVAEQDLLTAIAQPEGLPSMAG